MAVSQVEWVSRQTEASEGPDPFGYEPAFVDRCRPLFEFFYRRYWRVQSDGLENIPDSGPALIISNHSGGIPVDAVMLGCAVDLDHPQHRLVRFLYDRFVEAMPKMGEYYHRLGSVTATFDNARRLLEMGDLVGLFPEGVAGIGKGIWRRYRLQRFNGGFIRLSLSLRVPIIPAVVVGAEEVYPVIGRWQQTGLKQLFNIPYVPVTPLFPWLGAIGLIPLPTKWHIRFGAPIRVYADGQLSRTPAQKTVRRLAEDVRREMQAMLHTLLAERESIF